VAPAEGETCKTDKKTKFFNTSDISDIQGQYKPIKSNFFIPKFQNIDKPVS